MISGAVSPYMALGLHFTFTLGLPERGSIFLISIWGLKYLPYCEKRGAKSITLYLPSEVSNSVDSTLEFSIYLCTDADFIPCGETENSPPFSESRRLPKMKLLSN
jgi:hypothetical protein